MFRGNLLFVAWNIEHQIHTDEYCRCLFVCMEFFHASKEGTDSNETWLSEFVVSRKTMVSTLEANTLL